MDHLLINGVDQYLEFNIPKYDQLQITDKSDYHLLLTHLDTFKFIVKEISLNETGLTFRGTPKQLKKAQLEINRIKESIKPKYLSVDLLKPLPVAVFNNLKSFFY